MQALLMVIAIPILIDKVMEKNKLTLERETQQEVEVEAMVKVEVMLVSRMMKMPQKNKEF